ncbi:hypothetical protein HY212_01095 [Candidatus Pacearchaeota archaeon]|nr:hypothetical protein [Candidatus Pacearchaeota archaeon]
MKVYEYIRYGNGKQAITRYLLVDENPPRIIIEASSEEELGRRIRQYVKDQASEQITNIQNMKREELTLPSSSRLHSDHFGLRRPLSSAQLEKVLVAASMEPSS